MKQYKLLGVITFTILLLVITSISAQDCISHKLDTDLNLVVVSNNASGCNVSSIQYPGGAASLVNYKMAKSNTNFNYTIDDSNFSSLGFIYFGVTCTDNSTNEAGNVCREITPNGVVQSTAQGIGSAMFLGLMLVLTFLFGWIGFKLAESDNLWVLGIFFMFLAILFIVYDVWLGYEYHRNFTGATDSGMPEIIFYTFMFLLISGLLVSLALLFTKWKKLVKYIKEELADKEYKQEEDETDRDFNTSY